ncbi:hypothetical protein SAMN04488556_3420 [Halostagnicola kamekurae]|uniref:Uncharacterized protein n=1 Tax=Halostagnicola kamekurae TaxID=619731 RepID=A0A1I6TTW9_9EURY|nr:hypothetical protein SAMN04488556_3420 [Halostagnicola kamekurae]
MRHIRWLVLVDCGADERGFDIWVVDVPSFRISAVIQVHTDKWIVVGKHEPDAIRFSRVSILERRLD